MRRTIRSAACSAALVGLSALLGACDAVAPTAAAPEAAPAASLSTRVGQVQQERLREAGRLGLKRGVNYAPSARLQEVVESRAPLGPTRSQSAPAFRVQNLRLGDAARPLPEEMATYRTKGGEVSEGTGTTGGGEPGEVGVANHESWEYSGYSHAQWAWGSNYAWIDASTWASKNITYIDVIADLYSYSNYYGYPTTVYDYAENAGFAAVSWTHWGWGETLELYVSHYVYNEDGYGTYSDEFFTADQNSWDGYSSYSGLRSTSDPDGWW